MLVVETILGNIEDDPVLERRFEARPEAEVEQVVLDERDRRRSRIRTETDAGTDIGIVVGSDQTLRSGDVLLDDERMVVVRFENREALVISFEGENQAIDTVVRLTELGYQVGNRHWDLAVRDEEVLVALGTDSERKRREIGAALPSTVQTRRETVDPTLFDGTPGHGTSESESDEQTHSHAGHAHGPTGHTHDTDGTHSHDHSTDYRTLSTDETGESE